MSIISLKESEKGNTVSLAQFFKSFFETDTAAKQAQISAEAADRSHPELVKRLSKVLTANGFENKVIVVTGFKKKLVACADSLRNIAPKDIEHAVVRVGGLIIDICRLRLGNDYDVPSNYVASMVKQYWTGERDVTKLLNLGIGEVRTLKSKMGYALSGGSMLGKSISLSLSSAFDPVFVRYKSDTKMRIPLSSGVLQLEKGMYLIFKQGRNTDTFQLYDQKEDRLIRRFTLDVKTSDKLLSRCSEVTKGKIFDAMFRQAFARDVKPAVKVVTPAKKPSVIKIKQTATPSKALKVAKTVKEKKPAISPRQVAPQLEQQATVLKVKPKVKVRLPSEDEFEPDRFVFDPSKGSLKIDSLSSERKK